MCRHSLRLKPNSRGPLTCIRLYDRLPRPETGSLLTVTPPVMNGPPSPAAWMGMGSVRMSTASPVTTLAFHAASGTRTGWTALVGSSARPMTSTTWPFSQPSASAARVWLATADEKTGHAAIGPPPRSAAAACSNSGAGPLCRSSAAATSASSWSSDTGRPMRASCPADSRT